MAISAGMAWEVRGSGSDSNGGGFRGGSPLPTPSAPTVSGSGTGGTVAANTYYVVVTLSDGNGETPKSAESSVTTTGTTSSITVTHPTDPVSQGSSWNVYVGTVTGGPYFSQGTGLVFTANRSITTTPPTTGTQAPGVDYSQQDSPQVTYTDLVIDGTTNTKATSAASPFAPNHVGNVVNITGGAGFTVQAAEVVGVAAGVATFDKGLGTLSSTGGVGVLGGALASPGMAGALGTSGNGLFLKYNATSYSCSATANVPGGRINSANFAFIAGYDTTRDRHNADANRPTLAAGANSMTIVITTFGKGTVANLIVDGTGRTAVVGIGANGVQTNVYWCKALNCATTGITQATGGIVVGCSAVGCGTGITVFSAVGCTALNCTGNAFSISTTAVACVAGGGNVGFVVPSGFAQLYGCVAHANTTGFSVNGSGPNAVFFNCVAYANTGTGFSASPTSSSDGKNAVLVNCAAGANGTDVGGTWKAYQITSLITLTAPPFADAAGLDFSPNNVAGGGALLRAAGYPSALPGLATTSSPDVGAVQHAAGQVTWFEG